MLAKMSHNWLRTMMLITNPLTTIGPCMARERFCAMQSPFQIRICRIHDEHGYCDDNRDNQSHNRHNFSAPFKCDQRARRDVTSNFIFCNLTAQCSLHHTRMWHHFTCLSRIFRRKRFTGCWLPRTPWDFDFFVAIFFIVPCKKSKLALDLDVSLNHIFLKHSKCIEHFHRKCFKNFVTLIFHTLYVASPWTANIFCLVIQFWNPDMLHTVAVDVETSRTEGSLLQVASTYEWNSRKNK